MPHHQPQNSNNLAEITNLLDSIGIIEESPAKSASSALSWLAIAKGTLPSGLNYPRLSVFIGNHGFAEDFPSDPKNEQYVNKYVRDCGSGNLTLNRLAEHANCDIRLYELNPSGGAPLPNAIKTKSPATSETDLCLALAYGMVSVEPEIDLYAPLLWVPEAKPWPKPSSPPTPPQQSMLRIYRFPPSLPSTMARRG